MVEKLDPKKIILIGFALYFTGSMVYGFYLSIKDPETRKYFIRKILLPNIMGGVLFGFGNYYWLFDLWKNTNDLPGLLGAIMVTFLFIYGVFYLSMAIDLMIYIAFPYPHDKDATTKNISIESKTVFCATRSSNKYHRQDCIWAQTTNLAELIGFKSPEEATEAGYIPCKVCKPPVPNELEIKKRKYERVQRKRGIINSLSGIAIIVIAIYIHFRFNLKTGAYVIPVFGGIGLIIRGIYQLFKAKKLAPFYGWELLDMFTSKDDIDKKPWEKNDT